MAVEVLIKPIITEKMTQLGEKLNRFGFVVTRDSNKIQIKKAIEQMYGVSVKNVNTMVAPGKAKSRNTKKGLVTGIKSPFKKAMVTLADGETIDFYSNI
jgi:large subunit ribosomal protein L23